MDTRPHPHLDTIRRGARVEQGQVIGYVGKTGLATGPHLHYEFRVDGVHQDPLKVERPRADPVPKEKKEQFLRVAAELNAELDAVGPQTLAASP